MHLLLITIWLLSGAPQRPQPATDESYFIQFRGNLRSAAGNHPVQERPGADRKSIREEGELLRRRLARGEDPNVWAGEYASGGGYGGERLVLACGRFVSHRNHCCGSTSESGVTSFTNGILEFHTRIGPLEFPPPHPLDAAGRLRAGGSRDRRLVPTPCAGGMYLLEPAAMLRFVEMVGSGEVARAEFGSPFLHRILDPEAQPTSRIVIPEGYRWAWDASPHFRVLQMVEATRQMPTQIELESDGRPYDRDRREIFYWDGDPSGQTRALELSRTGNVLLAYLPLDNGSSPAQIQVGTTFSSLPNLR